MPVTGTFRVRDGDGREYVVNWEIDTSSTLDPSSLSVLPRYRLADGTSSLKLIAKGVFEIEATGKQVRRIS